MALLNQEASAPRKWLSIAAPEQGAWPVVLPIWGHWLVSAKSLIDRTASYQPWGLFCGSPAPCAEKLSCSPAHCCIQPPTKTLSSIPGNLGSIPCSLDYSGIWIENMTSGFVSAESRWWPIFSRELSIQVCLIWFPNKQSPCWAWGLFCMGREANVQPHPTSNPNQSSQESV